MNHQTKLEQAHGEVERIFRNLLPQNGMAVREEQISLCHAMLDALFQNKIILCDAGTGTGKTYAYLTACILLQKFYPARVQPVLISTSSVTLQDAIMKEYIPSLSEIFLKKGIIFEPIRAVIRKGKERFVCDELLSWRLNTVRNKKKNAEQLKALQSLQLHFDMDTVTGTKQLRPETSLYSEILPKGLRTVSYLPLPELSKGLPKRGDHHSNLQPQLPVSGCRTPFAGNPAAAQ